MCCKQGLSTAGHKATLEARLKRGGHLWRVTLPSYTATLAALTELPQRPRWIYRPMVAAAARARSRDRRARLPAIHCNNILDQWVSRVLEPVAPSRATGVVDERAPLAVQRAAPCAAPPRPAAAVQMAQPSRRPAAISPSRRSVVLRQEGYLQQRTCTWRCESVASAATSVPVEAEAGCGLPGLHFVEGVAVGANVEPNALPSHPIAPHRVPAGSESEAAAVRRQRGAA